MAAFVGAILCQASDRTAWLAAVLSDRYQKPGQLIIAAAFAMAISNGLAAAAANLIAPLMSPNARALLLGLALVSAGISALFRLKPPAPLGRGRAGAFVTALLSLLAVTMGDRTQFLTMAVAARTPLAALAAIGATLGSLIVVVPAILAGESSYRSVPHRSVRLAIGLVLIITGLVFGLGAMRLI
ncbi:TMEM165/GDT1 family protein [Sphingomonas sp. 28-63-12]|uniref:TMEM165/GDT1 family protein n=1 Tax=Sphingomonas sp. 28-63-12 TaxID=1970434 RepID=UPI0035A87BA9